MPGQYPCEPGCTCGHHNRQKLSPEERQRRLVESRRRSYLKNADKRRAEALAWNRANPEKVKERARERNARMTREERRAGQHKWQYGITPEAFERMLAEQEGCCYLCREPLDLEKKRGVHVDHDHSCCRGNRSCGKCIRGLACHACNTGVGAFGDDPERMIIVAERLAAAIAKVAARTATKPVQAELFDINEAVRRREESALWLLAKALGACSTSRQTSAVTPATRSASA